MTTHEEVIAAARECIEDFEQDSAWSAVDLSELERFYDIAYEAGRQAEREETLALLETYPRDEHWSEDADADFDYGLMNGIRIAIAAIRARSTK